MMPPKKMKLDGAQKAAILLMAMGDEFTRGIFKGLNEYEIRTIGKRMAELENVSIPVDTVQEIMHDFQELNREMSGVTGKGMDFLESSLVAALGAEKAKPIIDSINLSTEYDDLMQQPWLHSGMKVKIASGLAAAIFASSAEKSSCVSGT